MDIKEYNERKCDLEEEYSKKNRKLDSDYAKSNSLVKVGDIIEDHYKIILVGGFKLCRGTIPSLAYFGPRLRKSDLKPFNNGEISHVYQSNFKRVIK